MSKNETSLKVIGKERDELITVLGSSLYVGAKKESIELVLSYCEAAKLDPMQKPVHLVPMNTKNAQTGKYEWRDVIMPGIGLYRIQADRSGTMAGITEPEYGPMITETFKDKNNKDVSATFPEWCKITIKKIVGSHIVEFVAKEYWIENYATDSGQSTAPNKMWAKRSRGQIAKCAEAQALRKAFPEIGAQPTAEEMEGKIIDITSTVEPGPALITDDEGFINEDKFNDLYPKWEKIIQDGKKTHAVLLKFIENKGLKLAPGHIDLINKVEVTEK
jgi:phage recombination protein Bet